MEKRRACPVHCPFWLSNLHKGDRRRCLTTKCSNRVKDMQQLYDVGHGTCAAKSPTQSDESYLCVSVSKSNPATYNLHLKYITTKEREMQRSTGDTSGLRDRNTKAHGNDVRSARGSTTPDVFMLHVRPVHKYLCTSMR